MYMSLLNIKMSKRMTIENDKLIIDAYSECRRKEKSITFKDQY